MVNAEYSSSAQNPGKDKEGSFRLLQCTGPGGNGNGRISWTNNWVPTLVRKNECSQHSFCVFCADEEQQKVRCFVVRDTSLVIEADSIEKYERRENVGTFGEEEGLDENVFAKMVHDNEKAGIWVTAIDIITWHHLLRGKQKP